MFLISPAGIHVPLPEKGDAIGMFVPSKSAIRHYTDIQNPSRGTVKSKVGLEGSEQPLWRALDDRGVEFYGSVNEEVTERRSSVSVYLPKDFLPEGFSVFYYIFNDRWVVYGERVVSDEGASSWVYTKFDTKDENLADFLIGVISDRLVKGVREKICVAVDACPESEDLIKEGLGHFEIEVVPFSSLKIAKVKPVYQHKDFGLMMLLGFFCGFVLMAATVGLYAKSFFELNSVKDEVSAVRVQIQQMQSQMVLGYISDPKAILKIIKQEKIIPPSSLIHETATISSMFGDIKSLDISYNEAGFVRDGEDIKPGMLKRIGEVTTLSTVKINDSQLLIDQEKVAESILKSKDYVSQITRLNSDDDVINLAIKMQLKGKR
ncbi:MAG: hypothetical protein OSB62_07930 [Alphaproteobacteria bacterium]|nr:hypothetical protein [Alphaproteobacteria bacterium]